MRKKSEEAALVFGKQRRGRREGWGTNSRGGGGRPGVVERGGRWRQWQPTQQMPASCCMEAARLWVARRAGHTQREGPAGGCVSLSCHPPQRRARLDWS